MLRLVPLALVSALLLASAGCFGGRSGACGVSCESASDPCPGGLTCDVATRRCSSAPGECSLAALDADPPGDADSDGPLASPKDAPPDSLVCGGPGFACGLHTGLASLESGWPHDTGDGCEAAFRDETLELQSVTPGCAAGVACGLASPSLPLDTARVFARSVDLRPAVGAELAFTLTAESGAFLRLRYQGSTVEAVSSDGGGVKILGALPLVDAATYSIRVDASGIARFEVFVAEFVEIARGPSPILAGEAVSIGLTLACTGATASTPLAVWGEIGDDPSD